MLNAEDTHTHTEWNSAFHFSSDSLLQSHILPSPLIKDRDSAHLTEIHNGFFGWVGVFFFKKNLFSCSRIDYYSKLHKAGMEHCELPTFVENAPSWVRKNGNPDFLQ